MKDAAGERKRGPMERLLYVVFPLRKRREGPPRRAPRYVWGKKDLWCLRPAHAR